MVISALRKGLQKLIQLAKELTYSELQLGAQSLDRKKVKDGALPG